MHVCCCVFRRAFAAVASVANGNKRLMLLVTDFPRLLFVDVANNSAVLRGHIDLLIFDKCDSRTVRCWSLFSCLCFALIVCALV